MMIAGLLILVVLIVIAVPLYEWWTRPKASCPKCQSEAVELLSKDVKGKPIIHGSRVAATVMYHHRYHCKRCGERWEVNASESM